MPKNKRLLVRQLRYSSAAQKKCIILAAEKLQMSANAFITRSAEDAARAVLQAGDPPLAMNGNGAMLQASGA